MRVKTAALWIALATFSAPCLAQGFRHSFDFSESSHGFSAGFADHPQDFEPALYNLASGHLPRPQNLGSAHALFIGGSNRSDDLFMFWKKRITGLPPNAEVRVTMEIEFASNYAVGLVGIGGAPGEGVQLKAGAVPFEPSTLPDRENWLRMNLDKGNQSLGGEDMTAIGHIGKPDDGTQNHAILVKASHGAPLSATTSPDGSLWLVFGTDSGFEGRTELYYTRLAVWIDTPSQPALWIEPSADKSTLKLVWNSPGQLQSRDDLSAGPWTPETVIDRPFEHPLTDTSKRFWRVSGIAPTGNSPAASPPRSARDATEQ